MDKNTNTRREFLKVSAALAGTTLITSVMPWMKSFAQGETASGMANNRVNIAVIGVGSRGTGLLKNMEHCENIKITAICDNFQPRYDAAVKYTKGKIKAYKDYRKLLEQKDIDAVVIATPLHQHAHIAIDAMKAGKHVFCEKSMARTPEGCRDMVNTSHETGKILQIGHQRMFNPRYLNAFERIKRGEIGQLTQIRAYWHRNNDWRRRVPKDHPEWEKIINWRLYKEFSCGLMTELASHQTQVANWFYQEEPTQVMGSGSINYWHDGREVEDNVALVYDYPSGNKLIYDSMTSNRKYGLEEQIMGNKGTIQPEVGKIYMEKPPKAPGIRKLINEFEHDLFDVIPIGGASWVPETAVKYKGEYLIDDYKFNDTFLQMEGFARAVRKGKAYPGLLKQGYWASITALFGQEAMDENKIIQIPEEFKLKFQ